MPKLKTIVLSLICCLCVACSSTTSTQTTQKSETTKNDQIIQEIKDRGYLKVGVKTDVPGLSYYDGTSYSGLEIELAYKTAAHLFDTTEEEVKEKELVQFTGVTVADREEKLENGDVDCLFATYTITKERKEKFALSDSYYKDYIGLMVLNHGSDQNSLGSQDIGSIADLDGKIIGVARNSTTRDDILDYLDSMNSLKVNPQFAEYTSYDALYTALQNGDIDVISVDVSILSGYVDNSTTILDDRFAGQNYGSAVKLENEDLLEYINEAINE